MGAGTFFESASEPRSGVALTVTTSADSATASSSEASARVHKRETNSIERLGRTDRFIRAKRLLPNTCVGREPRPITAGGCQIFQTAEVVNSATLCPPTMRTFAHERNSGEPYPTIAHLGVVA